MTNVNRHIVLVAIMSIFLINAFGQNEEEAPAVKVMARATDRSVKLRWGPNTPAAWQLANKYGYTVERILITENEKRVERPVKQILNPTSIKPATQQFWEPFIDGDDYVAVAAQAIYGETFELTEDDRSNIMKVVNKAKELESRYSFTIFAADQSIKAAELSGLFFEDHTLAPKTKYLYRVYANIPTEILKVDTGFVFIGLDDFKPLPKPLDFRASFQDQSSVLSWNGEIFERIYNSYWVERSDDGGKTFSRITEQPIVNAENSRSRYIFKLDSLPANEIVYHYRVMGINAFGEVGPPSDVESGSGKAMFAYSATITHHEITPAGKARIEWTFPKEGEKLLKAFELVRINQATKVSTELKQNIEKNLRTIEDEQPQSTNYYVIRAVDKYGRKNNSFPYLVQTVDSIPPAAPTGLTGLIDTLGRVYLKWDANAEEDIEGYSIYRANFSTDEYIQKPGPIISGVSYVDTLKLNTLTETIYYKVRAVDKRFNPSDFSTVLQLKKPDKIPPVPPVLSNISSDSTGINVFFEWSSSDDVVRHLLYRRSEKENEWSLLRNFEGSDTLRSYHDALVTHRTRYAYTLLAIDDDGLESQPAPPITSIFISNNPYPAVDNIFYSVDTNKKVITISWNYERSGVDKFMIYKSNNGQPLSLFKSVDANSTELSDSYGINDTRVEYRIVAGFKTGERTRSSRPLIVKM